MLLFQVVVGFAWWAFGVYISARPDDFLRKTQFPWTKLPV